MHIQNTSVQEANQVGFVPNVSIWLNTNPTAGNTLVTGSDTYEFLDTATAISNDTFIGVLRGGDAAASRVNLANAYNNVGTGIADGLLAVGGGGPLLLENGTENIWADGSSGYFYVWIADAPGGTKVPGPSPNLALSATLTSGDPWLLSNFNLIEGFEGGSRKLAVFGHRITADAIGNGELIIGLPFALDTNSIVTWHVRDSSNIPVVRDDDISWGSTPLINISFNAGVAPNLQANDWIYFTIWQ